MTIVKKTLKSLNISHNDLIRYMTGLSRNSHISNTLKILKLFNISELYISVKLIFVKNLKSNFICTSIFNYLLFENQKSSSFSFMKEFKIICAQLNLDVTYAFVTILVNYKKNTLQYVLPSLIHVKLHLSRNNLFFDVVP
jgi:hypothetical protein